MKSQPNEKLTLSLDALTDESVKLDVQSIGARRHRQAHGVMSVSSGVYVVSLAGDEVCKRLEARPGGVVRVISDNRLYEEYDIDLATVGDDFMVIGKVIWFAGLIT